MPRVESNLCDDNIQRKCVIATPRLKNDPAIWKQEFSNIYKILDEIDSI